MKQFPITLSDTIKSTHSSFYPEHALPLFDYGKKLYIEYEGKIRAAIPLYSAFVTVPGGVYGRKKTNLTGFNIAGVGKKDIECDMHFDGSKVEVGYAFPRLFKTLEDYDRFIENKGGAYRPDAVSVPDILRVNGYSVFCEVGTWENGIVGYFYHRDNVTRGTMPFCDMFVDADGAHVTVLHRGTGWAEDKVAYLTREECLAANRKEVVDFEEEKEEPAGAMNTTNGHDPDLVARINAAWDTHQTWWEFTLIVGALMHRDGSQILEMLGKEIAEYADDEKMVAELGPDYLQTIADDQDLKQILDFIGR